MWVEVDCLYDFVDLFFVDELVGECIVFYVEMFGEVDVLDVFCFVYCLFDFGEFSQVYIIWFVDYDIFVMVYGGNCNCCLIVIDGGVQYEFDIFVFENFGFCFFWDIWISVVEFFVDMCRCFSFCCLGCEYVICVEYVVEYVIDVIVIDFDYIDFEREGYLLLFQFQFVCMQYGGDMDQCVGFN